MLINEIEALISDFVGGPLLCQDKGNREDYYIIMLALFKPWHTGLELKDAKQF